MQSFVIHCRWILLEVLDKVSPGSVNWKHASKPPIKMPFRKVENCNQVVRIGKQLKFSLVNVAGNDIVQGNKKLILGDSLFSYFGDLFLSPNRVFLSSEMICFQNSDFFSSRSFLVAIDEIQHASTSEELEISFPRKGDDGCRYPQMG